MAVLVEAISVVVRRDAIDERFSGGWQRFVADVPNATLCTDDELTRVGFMSPAEVQSFVNHLEENGLLYVRGGFCEDIVVVDQFHGPTAPVYWLECAELPIGEEGGTVAACWLWDGPRMGDGIHATDLCIKIATPACWRYEQSLSATAIFVSNDEVESRLRFLRTEDGVPVFLDTETGKEVYGGGTKT